MDFDRLPCGPLVRRGLEGLAGGQESKADLPVLNGAPRLTRLGICVPATGIPPIERHRYDRLARRDPAAAHSRYDALNP